MDNESATEEHVLVVEDEPDFAALLRSILAGAGYSVETAYNCDDAILAVHKQRPDIITLDIQMPRKSGALFYRKLKADPAFRHIPVVVVTGLTHNDKDMENTVRAFLEPDNVPHPQAYVEKPVDGPRFLKTLEEVLLSTSAGSC
jgi:CheY-like chemotaxis protein